MAHSKKFLNLSSVKAIPTVVQSLDKTFTTSIIESRSGSNTVVPSFPNDRVVSGYWTAFIAKNDTASDHTNIINATRKFPLQTQFASTYPSDNGTTVRAFAFLDFGNYLDGNLTIATSKISNIRTLTTTWDFNVSASVGAANGCLDWFLFSTTAGTTATIVDEIQVYWDTPNSTKTGFLDTLPVVGTYASAAVGNTPALNWKVTYQASNAQGKPYFQFRPIDGASNSLTLHAGSFDLAAAMTWLMTQNIPSTTTKCLTGNEYFTGFGNGYEILNGNIQLDVNSISTTYLEVPTLNVYATGAGSVDVFADFIGVTPYQGEVHLGRNGLSDMAGSVPGIQKPGFSQMGAAVPLIPTGGTLEACARGDYDSTFTTIATNIYGYRSAQNEIQIRLGWEFNHTFQEWSIYTSSRAETVNYTNAQLASFYVAAFQRVVGIFRGISNKFKFTWCINNGVYDFTPAYPGDSFVDRIGDDFYYSESEAGSSDPLTVWAFVRDRPFGLNAIADFALSRGKPLVISEWGVSADYSGAYVTAAVAWASARGVQAMAWWESNGGYTSRIADGSIPHVGAAMRNAFNSIQYPSSTTVVLPTVVPTILAIPTISGILQSGQTLTVTSGVWTKQPTSYAYRWLRNGTAISGATSSTYILVDADISQTITAGVTASNGIGAGTESVAASPGSVFAKVTNNPDITDYATNQIGNPSDLTQTGWDKLSSMTVSTGQLNLDSTTTAQLILENATTTKQYGIRRTDITKVAGTRYRRVFRADFKNYNRQYLRVQIATSDYATGVNAFFDLVNGTAVYTPTANAGSIAGYALNQATIAPLAFGWFRLEVDYYTDTATAGQVVALYPVTSTNDFANHAGDTTKGFYTRFFSQVDAGATLTTQTAVPANTSVPLVWGLDMNAGTLLTVWPGVWTLQPISYAYQWYANGVAISGATNDRYTIISANAGATFTCAVTPTNNFGTGTAVTSDGTINDGIDHTQEWLTTHNFPDTAEPVDSSATPAYGTLLSGATNVASVDFRPTGNINTRALLDSTMFYTTLNGASETSYPATAVTSPIDDPTSGVSYGRVRRYPAGHRYDLHTFNANGLKLGVIGKNNGKTATLGNVYSGMIRPQFKFKLNSYVEFVFKGPLSPWGWMPLWFFTGDQISPGRVTGANGNPNYKPDGTHSIINRASLVVTTTTAPATSSQYHEYDLLDGYKFTSSSVGVSIAASNIQRTNRQSGLTVNKGYLFYEAGDNGFAVSPDSKFYNILTGDAWNDGFHTIGLDWKQIGSPTTTTENGVLTNRYVTQLSYLKDGKIFRQEYYEYINNTFVDPILGTTVDPTLHCLIGGQAIASFTTGASTADISNWDNYSLTLQSYKVWSGNIDLTSVTRPTNNIPVFNDLTIGSGSIPYAGKAFVTYIGGKQPSTTDALNTKVIATSDDGTAISCVGSLFSATFASAGTKTITLTEIPDAQVTGTVTTAQGYGAPKTTTVTLVVQATDPGFVTGGATNLKTYSEQLDNAVNTKTSLTVNADVALGPDGVSTTADDMVSVAATAAHGFTFPLSVTNGSYYTISILTKKNTMKCLQIGAGSTGLGGPGVNFDLDNAGLPTVLAATSGGASSNVKVLGPYNGFYRLCVTFKAIATTTATIAVNQYISTSVLRGAVAAGTTADKTTIGGIQVEAGQTVGNYTVRTT